MKMLLVIYNGSNPRLVPSLFDAHHANGYTEVCKAHGTGTTGRYEGSRAWPGDSSLYFSIVPEDKLAELTAALGAAAAELDGPERLHCAVLPTETFF